MHNTILKNFVWKYIERCGYQLTLAIVNIVLARMLGPSYFGDIAIINIVVVLAQSFVQQGLSTALVREKEVCSQDYINMLLASTLLAAALYFILFCLAPLVASFYELPGLTKSIRLMGVVLFPSAFNAVQNAKIVREAAYKKLCFSSITSVILSGLVGILLAKHGFGVYSLVWQQISFRILFCITMLPIVKLKIVRPAFTENFRRMFKFGFRLMLSSFLNQLYTQIQTLVVGKKYDTEILGSYNQGNQYPYLVISNISTSMQTVILPEFSARADNKDSLKMAVKSAIILSSYIICPLMLGLFFVADNFVIAVLTPQWVEAIPYIRVFCLAYVTTSLSVINLQAFNAIGRSDIVLKNEVLKKVFGLLSVATALFTIESPIGIAVSIAISNTVSCLIDMHASSKLLSYPCFSQLADYGKNLLISALMGIIVCAINLFELDAVVTLVLQVVSGIGLYWIFSFMCRVPGYIILNKYIKRFIER